MKYLLTPHARARLAERKVPEEWFYSVMESPQQKLTGNYDREIRQSVFERDNKRWLLRVIVEIDVVLTVLLTSKVEKYGGLL